MEKKKFSSFFTVLVRVADEWVDKRQHIRIQQHWWMRQAPHPPFNAFSFAGPMALPAE
ncbi:MAG: hypothetical protein Q7U30_03840 [Methylicorpusculum sp.]|nr:hypothetical protein [Methylicorpusculum sp.]